MMTVGERIRQKREELGLSQMELATKMGYKTKSAICNVEKSGDNITTDRVVRFAEALGTTPAYLMGWKGENIDYIARTDKGDVLIEVMKPNKHKTSIPIEYLKKIESLSEDELDLIINLIDKICDAKKG